MSYAYCIEAESEFDFDTDEVLYWHSEEGWVTLEMCDTYTEEEANCPIPEWVGGNWVKKPVSTWGDTYDYGEG
tara:strand:- start:8122 stop:8340 length:219 start_codon:yes stop_codon:yes gene_type:complete